jgi:DNA-binding CsgD family transcriptional regulator
VKMQLQQALAGLLRHLNDRERKIIVGRCGLGGTGGKTLEQLGKELGITKERVRQIETRAKDKLRTLAEAQTLDLPASGRSPRHAYFYPEPIWRGKPGVSDAGDRDTEQERRESTSSSTTRANPGARQCSILALN